jgi:hypothetical protein
MTEAATRAKLSDVLRGLEKPYGKVFVLPEEPPLDHAVFLLLREGWDWRKAQKALRILQKDFIDWNEVRVSSAAELKSALAQEGGKDLDVKVEKIRALLAALWKERNATSLDFLREMEPDSRRRLLTALGVLSPAHVQILMQCLNGPETMLVSQPTIRTLSRIGLIDRVHSVGGAQGPREARRSRGHLGVPVAPHPARGGDLPEQVAALRRLRDRRALQVQAEDRHGRRRVGRHPRAGPPDRKFLRAPR